MNFYTSLTGLKTHLGYDFHFERTLLQRKIEIKKGSCPAKEKFVVLNMIID